MFIVFFQLKQLIYKVILLDVDCTESHCINMIIITGRNDIQFSLGGTCAQIHNKKTHFKLHNTEIKISSNRLNKL